MTTKIIIEPPSRNISLDLDEIWRYRALLYFFTLRNIRSRYRQSVLGIGWAVLQPFLTMVIFTIVFGIVAKFPSDDIPYPLFTYSALLPWTLFATSLTNVTQATVQHANLITKIYFPRLIIPISGILAPLADFFFASFILGGMMVWYGYFPSWHIIFFPVFLIFTLITAFGFGLWFTTINTRFRDVGYVVPFFIQLWMYASPVVYPASRIPEHYQFIYWCNPMSGAIEGFRWCLLGEGSLDLYMGMSVIIVVLVLLTGLYFFKRMEHMFADVV
jgi:lipopolysaccharide transport system permease protein